MSRYYFAFLQWVGRILPDDKKKRFEEIITLPLPTTELMKDIYIGLSRIWLAKDYVEQYNFKSSDYEMEFADHLKAIKASYLWRVEGWSMMKSNIDAVVVVTIPEEQVNNRPAPEFMFVTPDQIIDICVNDCNEVEYLVWQTHEHVYVWDDTYMRKYTKEKGKKINSNGIEIEHKLGYCPAKMFWSDKLSDENYINKRSPVTDSLGDLDWLLFHKVSERYLELGSAYPIYVSYEFVEDEPERTENDRERTKEEKKPAGSPGPGSYWTVPAPNNTQEVDMMNNPVQVISAEIEACEYADNKSRSLNDDIYRSCVGYDGEQLNDEAMNEKQVEASFKSREEVLINIANNYSIIMSWTYETIARLMYGEAFESVNVSFGDQFYLETEAGIMNRIKQARESRTSAVLVEGLEKKLFDTMYRNDPRAKKRAEMIQLLDPAPNMSIEEAKEYVNAGITQEEFQIKLHLMKYIRIFEADNGAIHEYESDKTWEQRINKINQILLSYASKQRQVVQD